jgi:hypothetical protein
MLLLVFRYYSISVFAAVNTVKQYLTKMRALKPQHVNTKLLTQNFFSVKSFYKCVMDDESYFMVEGKEWQQQSYYESEDQPATEVVKIIHK